MKTSNITGFQRIFTDNFHYADYQLNFTDSLAYMVQEYLYKRRDKNDRLGFSLDEVIPLYDFMTLVVNVVSASYSELGAATIKDIIRFLRQSKKPHEMYGDFEIAYKNSDTVLIFNARDSLILSLLWTAYIYTSFLKEICEDRAYIRATNTLISLIVEESPYDKVEIKNNPPFKYSNEARDLLGNNIAMKLREEEEMNKKSKAKEQKQHQKEENQTEGQKPNDTLNQFDEINRLNKEKDEMIIELLSPIFYSNNEDAREFLQKIKNMSDTEITDTVFEWVKVRKISDRSYKRDLCRILQAAKLYRSTESNWNTALRNHPK